MTSNTQKGFTLIESLVAIGILVTAIAAPLTIAKDSFFSAHASRDQVSAFYLAQEAIEYIRYVRDTNGLINAGDWLSGLSACIGADCRIDVPNNTTAACTPTCPALKFDPVSRLFNYASGNDTSFTRTVRITALSPTEAAIKVMVSWQTGLVTRTFSIKDTVTKWQR